MTAGLTVQQAKLLGFIRSMTTPDGAAPSISELGMAMGISSRGSIHDLLGRLKSRGLVNWTPGLARSVHLVEQRPAPVVVDAVRLLCLDSVSDGTAASRDEITARLAKAMGQGR